MDSKNNPQLPTLNVLTKYLYAKGGSFQQDRMIHDKKKSLDKALLYSYQAGWVRDIYKPQSKYLRALINPNKLKPDYDDKVISIPWESGFTPGTIFDWKNTGTKWLIYLQDLTELAYFRGDIRRCKYSIKWEDEENKIHETFAAIRGPVETKINYIQKNQISIDTPNHSLHIYMPKNFDTLTYFRRYSKFYLQDLDDGDYPACWRVEAVDSISMTGVLEVNAVEYYSNKDEDDIENGIAGGLIPDHDPNPPQNILEGDTFIKPKVTKEYKYIGEGNPIWEYDKKLPLKVDIIDDNTIKLKWISNYSGQFDLKVTDDYTKTIVVESLF